MSYVEAIPVDAGADLSGQQFKAIAIGGTIAANNGGAIGLLQNKPKSGEDAAIAYAGRSRFRAGAAVTAGNRMTVTTSGWLIAVTSSDFGCGTALESVSSGGIGEGIFNFAGVRSAVGSAHLT